MSLSDPKILHIITRLDPGGSATNTIVSCDKLRKHGFQTYLAYGVTVDPDGSIANDLQTRNIPVFQIKHLVRYPSPIKDLLTILEIRHILRDGKFDLVHTHSSKAGILGRIVARSCGVPVIHTPHGHIFYGYFGAMLTGIFVILERWAAKHTKRIISLTDIETRECMDKIIGTADQYVTIHSGVPLAQFRNIPPEAGIEFRKKMGIPENAFLFISVGRLVHVKGFDILLNSFAQADFKNKPVFLAIIGDGEERHALDNLSVTLGIASHVRFAGELSNIAGPLSAANAFVLASRNEGMGRAIIEAMCAGLPAIAPSVGGIPSVINNMLNGLLTTPESPKSMARAMETLITDRALCLAMGNCAAASVYPEYDENTMIEQLAKLYNDVLSSPQ